MQVKKLVAVNWGVIESREYPMDNTVLLTGASGSGKSSLLDGLQTIMTAAKHGLFTYNTGQQEASQSSRTKSPRTLASYIAGGQDNLFARPHGTYGYIAAVWTASQGEDARVFTSLVASSVRVDGLGETRSAAEVKTLFILVNNAEVCFEDLAVFEGKVLESKKVETIATSLRLKYGPENVFVYEQKGEYLARLYGYLRGRQDPISLSDAEAAAKAWSRSMVPKEIGSPDSLIREEILESRDLSGDIARISDTLRHVSNVKAEAERIVNAQESLQKISGVGAGALEFARRYRVLQLTQVASASAEAAQRASRLKDEQLQAQAVSQGLKDQAASLDVRLGALREEQLALRQKQAGAPVAQVRQELQLNRMIAEEKLQGLTRQLKASVASIRQGAAVARRVSGLELVPGAVREKVGELLAQVPNLDTVEEGIHAWLNSGEAAVSLRELGEVAQPLLAYLTGPASRTIEETSIRRSTSVDGLEAEQRRLLELLASAKRRESGAIYPDSTQKALDILQAKLPQCQPGVVCDFVTPKSAAWQPAIEAYMGQARFTLVVEPEYEQAAAEVLKEAFGARAPRIIQSQRVWADAEDMAIPDASILTELEITDSLVEAYLKAQYGRVVKITDPSALKHVARGVMQDGRATGAGTRYVAKLSGQDLAFGLEARRQAVFSAQDRLAELSDEIGKAKEQSATLGSLSLQCRELQVTGVGELEQGISMQLAYLAQSAEALAKLDVSELAQVDSELASVERQLSAMAKEHSKCLTDAGAAEQKADGLRTQAASAAAEVDRLRVAEASLQQEVAKWAEIDCSFNVVAAMAEVSERVAARVNVSAELKEIPVKFENLRGQFYNLLAAYNSNARVHEAVHVPAGSEESGLTDKTYASLVEIATRVAERLSLLEQTLVPQAKETLGNALADFNSTFSDFLCDKVRSAVDDGIGSLVTLNKELEKLSFANDKFAITWDWVPEYKEYYDFFEAAAIRAETKDDLFADEGYTQNQLKVKDRLQALLLDPDQDRARRELRRLTDYRNYRRYDIEKTTLSGNKIRLSTWGTGSGGELETPAYLVRAAVLTNALKHFTAKGSHLRMMATDESFAKLDEERTRRLLEFFKDNLGLQLIVAMPTIKAGPLRNVFDREWTFSAVDCVHGELTKRSEVQEKVFKKKALGELFDQHRAAVAAQTALEFESASA